VGEQVVGRHLGPTCHRDPDADGNDDRPAVELDRLAERSGDTFRRCRRLSDAADPIEQDREFIAALARRDIRCADGGAEATTDFGEQSIAGAVTKRIIDNLEVVEVKEQDGDVPTTPVTAGDRPLDVIPEEDPVGESGQRIVKRVVDELLLEALLLGRVDEQAL
jgi:hypothetical protein